MRGAVVSAAVAAIAITGTQVSGRVLEDPDLQLCPDCVSSGWEVLLAPPTEPQSPDDLTYPGANLTLPNSSETDIFHNGVERDSYGAGYSEIIAFGGYSSYGLCTRNNRTEHINNHTACPLKKDWYQMWRPTAGDIADLVCWNDDMIAYPEGDKLNAAPGSTTIVGSCPKPGGEIPPYTWNGYDFRYGGVRPQDNDYAALYPALAKYIEAKVTKTGKKVVIRGCSGGTINGYAFLMSQTKAWRQKHIMAFLAIAPVFGGTISSLKSVLNGWNVGSGSAARCVGRYVAIHLPSVLWMWPHPGDGPGQWNKTEVLISSPTKNYTAYDLDELLKDLGLPLSSKIYSIEKKDYLDTFEPPMIDTYVFYGYGIKTEAAYKFGHNFSADTDGPLACPPSDMTALYRPWDDGDVTAPLRSTARARVWADAQAREGYVLRNAGYKGQAHACDCKTAECTKDYNCILNKLAGREHIGC